MSEEGKVYSDEEVALILDRAAELAAGSTAPIDSASGLSLDKIKEVASEVGLDPSFVEQAAHVVLQPARRSLFERLSGGPVRLERDVHVPARLTPERSARLLSVVRGTVLEPGEGHSDATGMSWHSVRGLRRVSIAAHAEDDGTQVRVRVDRRPGLVFAALWVQFIVVMAVWMLIESIDSYLDLMALATVPAGVLAIARTLWASSSRSIRARTDVLLGALSQALAQGSEESDSSGE